ncbi:MAG: hypothetical protein M3R60_12365, partial [Pseudomonadota bacterium]|nr:hypothetical protein [Pseudomonadota bacterium]
MNLRKTLLAASISAIPLMACGVADAGNMMGAPVVQSQQDNASLIGQLESQRGRHGLDSRHGFKLAKQHPGVEGTIISRADHTFKGVRVFQSESIVVTGPHGSIISESIADRRAGLNRGDMSVAPAISANAAIASVLRSLAGKPPVIKDPPVLVTNVVKDPPVLVTNVVKDPPVLVTNVVKDPPVLITNVVKDPPVLVTNVVKDPPVLITNVVKDPPVLITNVVRDPPVLVTIDPPLVAIDPPSAELIVYPVMMTVRVAGAANKAEAALNAVDLEDVVDHYELAYHVRTRMIKGNSPVYHDTIVSAKDGSVLDQWNMVQT